MMRASVVLPEPDSPTIPRHSPAATLSETCFRASTWRRARYAPGARVAKRLETRFASSAIIARPRLAPPERPAALERGAERAEGERGQENEGAGRGRDDRIDEHRRAEVVEHQ